MKNDSMTPEVLENRLVDFAVRIGKVADALPDTRLGQHIANQIVRSGTSPALCCGEPKGTLLIS